MGSVNSDIHSMEVTYLFDVLGIKEVIMAHNQIESVTASSVHSW